MPGSYVSLDYLLDRVDEIVQINHLRPDYVWFTPNGVRTLAKEAPAADVVEVVRCRDCKHRIVNEHYGEKGYLKLKAMCELDTGDPFEFARDAGNEDWYCADGERKDGGPDA